MSRKSFPAVGRPQKTPVLGRCICTKCCVPLLSPPGAPTMVQVSELNSKYFINNLPKVFPKLSQYFSTLGHVSVTWRHVKVMRLTSRGWGSHNNSTTTWDLVYARAIKLVQMSSENEVACEYKALVHKIGKRTVLKPISRSSIYFPSSNSSKALFASLLKNIGITRARIKGTWSTISSSAIHRISTFMYQSFLHRCPDIHNNKWLLSISTLYHFNTLSLLTSLDQCT